MTGQTARGQEKTGYAMYFTQLCVVGAMPPAIGDNGGILIAVKTSLIPIFDFQRARCPFCTPARQKRPDWRRLR